MLSLILSLYFQKDINKYMKIYTGTNEDDIILTNTYIKFSNKQKIIPKQDRDYIILIAFYVATFNDYENYKYSIDLLLITDKNGLPFIIKDNTGDYLREDAYYSSTYNERYTINKTLDYVNKNYICTPK